MASQGSAHRGEGKARDLQGGAALSQCPGIATSPATARRSTGEAPPLPATRHQDQKRQRAELPETAHKKHRGAAEVSSIQNNAQTGSSSRKQSWMPLARARVLLKELRNYMLPQRFRDQLAALLGQQAPLFRVAPSKITVEQFQNRYGMIQQIPDAMPPYDRFNRRTFRVREAAVRVVGGCVLKDVYTSARHLGFPRQETAGSSIFSRLLCAFALFMRYNAERIDIELDAEREAYRLQMGIEQDSEQDSEQDEEDDSNEEAAFLDLEFPDDDDLDADYQPTDDSEDLDMDPYVTSSDEEQAQRRWHSDILAFTTSSSGVRTLRLGIDVKTVAKYRDLLQVFMYVDGHTKRTARLGKEARPPTYLHAMDMREWRYGISEIDGYVQVKGNQLVEASLHSFPESPTESLSKEFTTSFTKQEVRDKFEAWRASLLSEGIAIPDDWYPVGRLYYCTTAWGMPIFEGGFAAISVGALKLYSGWLHILIGQRVRRWTPKKVLERFFSHEYAHLAVGLRRAGAPWLEWIKGRLYRGVE